ncbi:thiamine pyrophosphate-dependent enzyme [Klebsiella pneumoniae]|nr:thiamine pyrophosphate-dependent enzyme [Klebsiella pneumoniae]
MLTALYFRVLNVAPDRLDPQRDIYIQSKGHAVAATVPAEVGFFPVKWLETYQHANSISPATRCGLKKRRASGAQHRRLGRSLPVAVGLALAAKKSNSTRRIFLITGDGELAEGSNWEAALAAAHYGLDNLVIINDKNNLQLAGPTREIMNTDPLADKWRAFGMEVSECQGNDMASVVSVIEGLKQEGKPNVIIANTTKGAGISFIQGRPEWHHRVPKGEEIALALEELKDE